MGSSDTNVLKGRIRAGEGRYLIGSSVPYILAATVYRMRDKPRVIGAILTLFGYVKAMARRAERFGDSDYRRALRSYEWEVLLTGKQRTLRRRNDAIRARRASAKGR